MRIAKIFRSWLSFFSVYLAKKSENDSDQSMPVDSTDYRIDAQVTSCEDRHLNVVFLSPFGESIKIPDVGGALKLTAEHIFLIKESEDFIEQLKAMELDFSKQLFNEIDYDIYPILMMWEPNKTGSGYLILTSLSSDSNGLPVDQPPCGLWLADNLEDELTEEAINVFEGVWAIDNFHEIVNKYPARPLALIVTAEPIGGPLTAAALSFAGAYVLGDLRRHNS